MIRLSANTADFLKDTAPWLNRSQQQDLCEHLILDNPDLSYLLIVDRDGRAIAHSNPQRVGMVFNDTGTLAAARDGEFVRQSYLRDHDNLSSPYHDERIIDILYPIIDESGNPAGAVNIGLSMSRVDAMKTQYRLVIAGISLTILVSMLLFIYSFFSHVYRPIDVLVRATRKFRDDQAPARISTRGDDEFAELVGEFNSMSYRISGLIADLSRRERDLQEYVDHLLTFSAKLSRDGVIEIINRATPRPAGMRDGDLIGLRLGEEACWDLPAEARSRLAACLERAGHGEAVQYEETLGSAGSRATLDIGLMPVKGRDDKTDYIVAEIRDITGRKQAEDTIKRSLEEKEVLLKEIHHRVKNNLQIISSLLNLQSSALGDDASVLVYQESQNRIKSMALIHEKLYQSKDLSRIDFADYIQSLSMYLFQTYVKDQDKIRIDLQVERVPLCIDAAIPCGLIVNELVTNSLKHAFPGDRRGQVTIGLQVLPDSLIELRVGDDGVGLREGLDVANAKTLGLQLVYALASQLEGRVEVSRETGVTFRVTFRNPCA